MEKPMKDKRVHPPYFEPAETLYPLPPMQPHEVDFGEDGDNSPGTLRSIRAFIVVFTIMALSMLVTMVWVFLRTAHAHPPHP